ncbi:MAG: hypothetical protein Q9195_003526 [Heterodermia aff. obscurata]
MQHIIDAKRERSDSHNSKNDDREGRESLFHHILNSDMPESELADERLAKEAMVIMGAGTVTTGPTIAYISYYILTRPEIRLKLQEELHSVMLAWPQRVPSIVELEQLPYLQALIKEGLRYAWGESARHGSRVPVGMSCYYMHTDPSVYQAPFEFMPDRWLGEVHPNMNRNFVPFCRGSRGCLGMK